MGYSVAVHRDTGDDLVDCDYIRYGDYPGYAKVVNALVKDVLAMDTSCDWIVTGGDDTDPDPNKRANEIAAECSAHFLEVNRERYKADCFAQTMQLVFKDEAWKTFGVMQPTGDRFAGGSIDRIAGSPWMGREWCQRINRGRGPLWPEYFHMFEDQELFEVATKYGVYWPRPDLTHFHRHYMRRDDSINADAVSRPIPPHLVFVNSAQHWNESKAIFNARSYAGFEGCEPFPGSEPLPA